MTRKRIQLNLQKFRKTGLALFGLGSLLLATGVFLTLSCSDITGDEPIAGADALETGNQVNLAIFADDLSSLGGALVYLDSSNTAQTTASTIWGDGILAFTDTEGDVCADEPPATAVQGSIFCTGTTDGQTLFQCADGNGIQTVTVELSDVTDLIQVDCSVADTFHNFQTDIPAPTPTPTPP